MLLVVASLGHLANQIEQGKEEDPDDIHDVPIEPAQIDGREIAVVNVSFESADQQLRDDADTR